MSNYLQKLCAFMFLLLTFVAFNAITSFAQTGAFSYQGRLSDAGSDANGSFLFEFKLFDGAGTQVGSTLSDVSATVTNGVFTVQLDFGASAFNGVQRFLEISVRRNVNETYTTLTPRQPIVSSPYSIRSLSAATADTAANATNLGGTPSNQFVQTNDSRLSDARPPTAGSNDYIQNRTTPQLATNFSISGNGTLGGALSANKVNSSSDYNIKNNRVLSTPDTTNTFVGINAGISQQIRVNGNSFFGNLAGNLNTTGSDNSFYGYLAGEKNTTGSENAFFGKSAGSSNTEGLFNSFFGTFAGNKNTTGSSNSFFGRSAGNENTVGIENAFFGGEAGARNTTGNSNSFFGAQAGTRNTIGSTNSFFGRQAGLNNTSGSNNTIIGASAGSLISTGGNNTIIGAGADTGAVQISFGTAIGAGAVVTENNTVVLGRSADSVTIPGSLIVEKNIQVVGSEFDINGKIVVRTLGSSGSNSLCRNSSFQISTCSSSLRYKTNIAPFNSGLNLVNRLQPITFNWKNGGLLDLGLGAEDVAAIEPLLVTHNDKGEIEGVKYDRIGVVLLNAVKEQQAQIQKQNSQLDEQRRLLTQQQATIDGLKKLVCSQNPQAEVCK